MIAWSLLATGTLLFGTWNPGPTVGEDEYVCPPCGADCHDEVFTEPGNCGTCGMGLVPEATIPTIGVLLFDGLKVLSALGPAGLIADAQVGRIVTVADTTDPIRCQGFLTVLPKHDFQSAPSPRVLVLPSGGNLFDLMDDDLVLSWLRKACDGAEHVLAIGSGSLLLAAAGIVEDGEIATLPIAADRLGDRFPGITLRGDRERIERGKFLTVSSDRAGLHAALDLVERIANEEKAAQTARRAGFER